jgi:hypothetical protein
VRSIDAREVNAMIRPLLFLSGTVVLCTLFWYARQLARRGRVRRFNRQAIERWEDDGGVI